MTKKEAYNIVFWDLINIPLYKGKYDAKVFGKDRKYICGIETVMETISFGADPDNGDIYESFKRMFRQNTIDSELKAETEEN